MSTPITERDRADAMTIANLFGGNGLSLNQQLELAAAKIAEIRAGVRPPEPATVSEIEAALAALGYTVQGESGAWELLYITASRGELTAFDYDCALREAWHKVTS